MVALNLSRLDGVISGLTPHGTLVGDSGMKEYEARQSKSTRSKAGRSGPSASRTIAAEAVDLQHHFRIYFPTEKTVSSSRGGRSVSMSRPGSPRRRSILVPKCPCLFKNAHFASLNRLPALFACKRSGGSLPPFRENYCEIAKAPEQVCCCIARPFLCENERAMVRSGHTWGAQTCQRVHGKSSRGLVTGVTNVAVVKRPGREGPEEPYAV